MTVAKTEYMIKILDLAIEFGLSSFDKKANLDIEEIKQLSKVSGVAVTYYSVDIKHCNTDDIICDNEDWKGG